MSENTNTDTKKITVGELRRQLSAFSDDDELDFNGLSFCRLKTRGEGLVQVEFNEIVFRGPDGRLVVQEID